jgi:hypothetical protein
VLAPGRAARENPHSAANSGRETVGSFIGSFGCAGLV